MRLPALTPRRVAAVACLGLAVGSLGPWRVSLAASHSGLRGAGLYTLLLAAIAALLLIPRRPWAVAPLLIGVLCTLIAVVEILVVAGSTHEAIGAAPPSVEAGWGLWLAAAASLALASAGYLFAAEVSGRRLRIRFDPGRALLVVLGVGLTLRIWLCVAWSPALTGYSDSGIYFTGAVESLWSDPIRMVGYSIFLRLLHALTPHLIAVIAVQHAMGLAAAALAFFSLRRCGGPRWLGLAPAAVLALGGDQLFFEHAALSDALFVFLITATLYAALRASLERLWWAPLTGLLAGLAVWDRTVGLALVAVVVLWLAFSIGRPTRRTLTVAGAALLAGVVTVGIYAVWRSAAADLPGALTSNNAWNLYSRVAPWADCGAFTPPGETEALCEATQPSRRGYRSGEEYIYSPESPAQRLYGPPYVIPADPRAMARLQEWSEAAIRGQPLDYLDAIWLDSRRLFRPSLPSYGDLTADAFVAFLLYGPDRHSGRNEFVESWQSRLYPDDPPAHRGEIGPFRTWEAATRLVNLPMLALLLLAVAAPWLLSGRPRSGAILFAATALVLLFFPIASKSYDYRFVVPVYAPLVAAAALSGWGLARRLRA